MATVQAIKQLEEKNVASEIVLMVWSDRMDLVALANVKGEVALHRLTWTKAWSLSPPKSGLSVKGITWRPDGKIIAIAYSCGMIVLVKVENKNILHSINTKNDISCIYWTQDKVLVKGKSAPTVNEECKQKQYIKYIDLSSNFLPEPSSQNFDSASTCTDDGQKNNLLQDQNELNLLLIGTTEGIVHVQIFGCFPCALFNLSSYLNCSCSVENIHLSEGLDKMFITVRDSNNNVKIVFLNSAIFQTHTNELFAVALKHIKLMSLVNYLSSTITTITESWENILLEMDIKLSKYANRVPEGGVTADFLDLLMFGICSDEMKEFLIHDLTKKGLEKFGQTIEMSYSNIQKLMLKYVMKFGQNITYHLAEMRGMARWEYRYKILGLSEAQISEAILSNGAFMVKGGEMQQIINHSIINYKAFFRWLYTAIMHVMDEPIPNEIPKMTQQDLAYITEFLQNFDHIGTQNAKGFVMERLGQYLNDGPLTIKPDMSGNEWTYFLAQNQCVQIHPSVVKHYEDMSLIQQYKHLKKTIDDIFQTPKNVISERFKIVHVFNCFQYEDEVLKMTQINMNEEVILFAFLQPPETVLAMQIHADVPNCYVKCGKIYFSQFLFSEDDFEGNYNVVDFKLYSNTILSVLLQENKTNKSNILYQLQLTPTVEKFSDINVFDEIFKDNVIPNINGSCLTPKLFKNIEGMTASSFAVSGSRRVGIVLAENKRKVRLYEMEGEEEEDEDADMTNSTMKEDMSIQESNITAANF